MVKFPERVFTVKEVQKAKEFIIRGYKHRLRVKGSPEFESKVKEALKLIKTAKYYDFIRTYIRRIVEIDGFSQLREAEVAIWANKYAVTDPVEAASFMIHKAQQMKDYLEGKIYYGGEGEIKAVKKRVEFLKSLKERSKNQAVKKRCEEILQSWAETTFP